MLDGVFGVTVVCSGASETDSHTWWSALHLTDSLLCFTVLVWEDSFHGLFYPLIAVISSIHNSCRLHCSSDKNLDSLSAVGFYISLT